MGGCGSKTADAKVDGQQQPPKAEAVATGNEDQVLGVSKLTQKVTLEKASPDAKLGMTISGPRENALFVKSIKEEGTVATYNCTKVGTSETLVCVGDFIVDVNGISGDAENMHQELEKSKKLVITLQRDAPVGEATTSAPVEAAPVKPLVTPDKDSQPEAATKIAEQVPESESVEKVADTTTKEEPVAEASDEKPECDSAVQPMDVPSPDVAIITTAVESAELPEAEGATVSKAWCGWSC